MIDPLVVSQLVSRRRDPLAALTPREAEVLALMAEGRSNVGIAQAMTVTEGAVEKYSARVFGKLGLHVDDAENSRVLAVLTWLRRG